MCRLLPSPWIKLVYDIFHVSREGDDPVVDASAHLGDIAHLHVAESPERSAPLAGGNIPYGRIVPAIRNAGYDGYWGLEYMPGAQPLEELKASIAMLRGC